MRPSVPSAYDKPAPLESGGAFPLFRRQALLPLTRSGVVKIEAWEAKVTGLSNVSRFYCAANLVTERGTREPPAPLATTCSWSRRIKEMRCLSELRVDSRVRYNILAKTNLGTRKSLISPHYLHRSVDSELDMADDTTLSRSHEDYLKVIYDLQARFGVAQTNAIAKVLNLTPPSVSQMVTRLAELRLVDHTRNRGVRLTKSGRNKRYKLDQL